MSIQISDFVPFEEALKHIRAGGMFTRKCWGGVNVKASPPYILVVKLEGIQPTEMAQGQPTQFPVKGLYYPSTQKFERRPQDTDRWWNVPAQDLMATDIQLLRIVKGDD